MYKHTTLSSPFGGESQGDTRIFAWPAAFCCLLKSFLCFQSFVIAFFALHTMYEIVYTLILIFDRATIFFVCATIHLVRGHTISMCFETMDYNNDRFQSTNKINVGIYFPHRTEFVRSNRENTPFSMSKGNTNIILLLIRIIMVFDTQNSNI